MKDKLDWKDGAVGLMKYIELVEMLLLPSLEDIEDTNGIYTIKLVNNDEVEKMQPSEHAPIDATICMQIFYDRYNSNAIYLKSKYKEYTRNETIQGLIKSLGLDVDKFWLLVLFLYDYCESTFYHGITMNLSPLEQIRKLNETIHSANENADMNLTLKIGRKKYEIQDSTAIKLLGYILNTYSNDNVDDNYFKLINKKHIQERAETLSSSQYIAFFARTLFIFFDTQPQVKAKRKKGANHSIKETDLVCQLIYFTDMSQNECWKDTENETLKAFLKQYKNYKYPDNISSIYPDFTL